MQKGSQCTQLQLLLDNDVQGLVEHRVAGFSFSSLLCKMDLADHCGCKAEVVLGMALVRRRET